MNAISYWEHSAYFSHLDVVVIGGGIVGLNAAICLKENAPQLKVTVLERGALPAGASTKNAGFACFGSMTELLADTEKRSENEVFELVKERWEGLKRLRNNLTDQAIRYQSLGGYELFFQQQEDSYQKCSSKLSHFNAILQEVIGVKEVFSSKDDLLPLFGFRKATHLL